MVSLVKDNNAFLQQLMENESKDQDQLIKTWDEAKVDYYEHEGNVIVMGPVGAQKIMHCLTYETVLLPGAPCFSCVDCK